LRITKKLKYLTTFISILNSKKQHRWRAAACGEAARRYRDDRRGLDQH